MKFPYISLDPILDEIAGQLKDLVQQGNFDRDEIYNYCIEAAKLIGVHDYDDNTIAIPIKNYVGVLPKSFYTCLAIWEVEKVTDDYPNCFFYNDCWYRRKKHMTAGDSSTMNVSRKASNPHNTRGLDTYTFKIPPYIIRTSFKEGIVGMMYSHLKEDNQGIIMVQDEINTLLAIKKYAIYSLLAPEYRKGNIQRYVYKDFEDDFYTFLSQAKGIQKLPDPSNLDTNVNKMNTRYSRFNIR